ncbi:hypothetical protein CYMTET_7956 [Cymbomonas tetramitiformis]|uniref:Uncharacterized protein n=1 Tax=Cymbomonas tetramitiformis TaxID=36881 RepID=A0AAE0LGY9_9CHLO|nr:hypothetical protein CYMTET_7956 [Cymbomonas tetramitiformis]
MAQTMKITFARHVTQETATATSVADTEAEKPPPPTVKKGDIVAVDQAKYEASVEALANQNPKMTGIAYIYESRGEILDLKDFTNGKYALVAWVGIPTAPAWLPVSMLNKVSLEYQRT